jgi:hypothetical protein
VSGGPSSYAEAGFPAFCRLPSCQQRFLVRAVHGSDGNYYCTQTCADEGKTLDLSNVSVSGDGGLSKRAAQIATVCECIDHCFAFDMWCYDFARRVDEKDMVMGLHVAVDLMSASTRLFSFVALRKLDEFFRSEKPAQNPDDLIAHDLGIDRDFVLGGAGTRFLTTTERTDINKRAAHLTEKLTLEDETEGDLQHIVERSRPIFERLIAELRKADTKGEAKQWLDKTEALQRYAKQEAERAKRAIRARSQSG